MRSSKRSLLVLAAIALVPLIGCKDCDSGSGSGATPSATASASGAPSSSAVTSASASSSAGHANRGGKFAVRASGATGALFRAAGTLEGLKDEQKTTIEKIVSDLREGDHGGKRAEGDGGAPAAAGDGGAAAGGRSAMKEAHTDLIAGVKAGKIDTAKMDAHHASFEKLMKERHEKENDALNRLYAALEPAQRTATVAAVKSAEEKRDARIKAHARPKDKEGDGGAAARPSPTRIKLERYTKDLDLDAEQMKKAQALIPKDEGKSAETMREEAKKDMEAILAAFEKEGFDAKKLSPADATVKKMRGPMDAEQKFLVAYVPILKPEQRDRFAQRLERNAQHGAGGHRGGGGGGDHGDGEEPDEQEP